MEEKDGGGGGGGGGGGRLFLLLCVDSTFLLEFVKFTRFMPNKCRIGSGEGEKMN